jgi:DNA invertase Pin-like site-specific DNA recombinase
MKQMNISEAAREMGKIKSEKKATAARENGKLGGRRPLDPVERAAARRARKNANRLKDAAAGGWVKEKK